MLRRTGTAVKSARRIKSNNTLLKVDKPQPTKTSSRETRKTVQYQSINKTITIGP